MSKKVVSKNWVTLGPTVEAVEPVQAGPPVGPMHGEAFSGLVPPPGWVRFQATTDERFTVVVRLNQDSPTQTAGHGGYVAQQRPGRVDAIRFQSRPHMEIPVGVIFDNVEFGHSVENEIFTLKVLAGIGNHGAAPPVYMDSGGLIEYDWQHVPWKQWVINDLQPERTNDIRNKDGHLIRASFTAIVWEYTDVKLIPPWSIATSKRAPGKHLIKNARYHVKRGDTLVSIARAELGSSDRWLELAKLNGLRGGEALKPGTVIRLR